MVSLRSKPPKIIHLRRFVPLLMLRARRACRARPLTGVDGIAALQTAKDLFIYADSCRSPFLGLAALVGLPPQRANTARGGDPRARPLTGVDGIAALQTAKDYSSTPIRAAPDA